MSNYKTVFFTLGILQIILGVSMFIPIIAQFIYSEIDSSFFGASIVTIIFGSLFFLSNLDHDKKLNLQQAFLLTALSWLSIAIFGSLPFIFSTMELSITDAFFESMSGITTTGSTIISNLESTPKGILLWRAILQWLGGIGIIVMAITLMPIMNVGGMQLFKISSNDSSEKILPKSKEIALRLIYIYSGLTALCALSYWIFGMGKFDSLTHSMTTIATGGFSNYNQSIGYFDSVPIEISSMIFIILGSIPFIAYIKFINGNKMKQKIIICGAGQVGYSIANQLSQQGHSITVIDKTSSDIQKINDNLDAKGIVGIATYPSVLELADAKNTDMIIAVTRNDETNMIVCQIAHSLFNVSRKIARIRSQDYLNPKFTTVYNKENLPIDVIISPEIEIAKSIQRKLEAPGALDSVPFAENKIRLLEILINENCNLINIKI